MDLKDCGKFLSNKEASAVTVALKRLKRADKARNEEKKQTLMEALAVKHPHRIDAIVSSLKYQRVALLDVSHALNTQFETLASQYHVPIDTTWI